MEVPYSGNYLKKKKQTKLWVIKVRQCGRGLLSSLNTCLRLGTHRVEREIQLTPGHMVLRGPHRCHAGSVVRNRGMNRYVNYYRSKWKTSGITFQGDVLKKQSTHFPFPFTKHSQHTLFQTILISPQQLSIIT